jgi:hypothetical protein
VFVIISNYLYFDISASSSKFTDSAVLAAGRWLLAESQILVASSKQPETSSQ